jgi:hypothetical protein
MSARSVKPSEQLRPIQTPDKRDTANAELFHRLTVACGTLSNPRKRAGYDVQHRVNYRRTWKFSIRQFHQVIDPSGASATAFWLDSVSPQRCKLAGCESNNCP